MAELDGLSFRLTTADDLDAIKSIDTGLTSELDYVVENYDLYVQDPFYYGALAEINGEAVAFVLTTVQMGGTKVYSRAGRTKVAWRNRGIFGMLQKFVRETLRDTVYPQLKYEEFTTHDGQPSLHKLINSPHYREVHRRAYLTFEPLATNVSELTPRSNVEEIGIDGVRRMLNNQNTRNIFFGVRLFVGYVEFEPIESELPLVAFLKPLILASGGPDELNVTQLTIGVKLSSETLVVQWMVPPNTESLSVADDFKDHLKLQWKHMVELNGGGKCVIVFQREYEGAAKAAAADLGWFQTNHMTEELIGYRREF